MQKERQMFQGFTKNASEFLWELAFNNEKPWFTAHRAEFEQYVNTPMKELMRQLTDKMNERWQDRAFEAHVSRIYRDARRLFGRPPYKDHIWLAVYSSEVGRHGPHFWFEISPAEYAYGMGWYDAGAAEMELYRRMIDANPARFERLAQEAESLDGLRIYGETYARPKGKHSEIIDHWYNRKGIGCAVEHDFGGDVLSPALADTLLTQFEKLMPMYEFLCELYRAGRKDGQE